MTVDLPALPYEIRVLGIMAREGGHLGRGIFGGLCARHDDDSRDDWSLLAKEWVAVSLLRRGWIQEDETAVRRILLNGQPWRDCVITESGRSALARATGEPVGGG